MNVSKRIGLYVTLGLSVVLALSAVFLYSRPGKFFRFIIADAKKERQRTIRLLSETDHQTLLEACRKLSREIDQGNQLPRYRYFVRHEPSPEITQFPKVILDLEPMFVDIWTDGRVVVGMSGGIHHYGVRAYPENYNKPNDDFEFGDKKIIDGLWYYEDEYNPKYDKWVESLLEKGKTKKEKAVEER
ncbi:MAG: hypothetical protein WBC05_15035 [Sedimentisphaerales bacterium]